MDLSDDSGDDLEDFSSMLGLHKEQSIPAVPSTPPKTVAVQTTEPTESVIRHESENRDREDSDNDDLFHSEFFHIMIEFF